MSRDLGLCLAGGGQRAFVQVGFLERWWPSLEPRVAAVSACSAGACFGVIWLTGRQPITHQYWLGRRDGITRNFDWGRLRRGGRLTPHIPIYPDTLRHALADGGFEPIKALPFPFDILAAALPPHLPVRLAVTLGMAGYSFERQLSYGKLHPKAGRRIGFTPFVLDARECADLDADPCARVRASGEVRRRIHGHHPPAVDDDDAAGCCVITCFLTSFQVSGGLLVKPEGKRSQKSYNHVF